MLLRSRSLVLALSLMAGTAVCPLSAGFAQERAAKEEAGKGAEGKVMELADGKLILRAPADWKAVEPKSRIVQYEFAAPADAKADSQARITVMGAGGSIADNIKRWYAQFEQPDGSASEDKAKTEKIQVAGQTIHLVDISGTFKDSGGGPFFQQRPPVMREKYRMLGAIIETKDMGQHFLKITGPADSVAKLKDGFRKMLEGLEVKK
jgi:hypothetical protein